MTRPFQRLTTERLLARVYLNLKGPKKKRDDWVTIAELVRECVFRFAGESGAAKAAGVSRELIKSIVSILTLPNAVKMIIKSRQIGYDAAQRLARVPDPKRQTEIALVIRGMTSHDARQVILFCKKNPDSDPKAFASRVSKSKGSREKLHLTVIPLADGLYSILSQVARDRGQTVSQLIVATAEKIAGQRLQSSA